MKKRKIKNKQKEIRCFRSAGLVIFGLALVFFMSFPGSAISLTRIEKLGQKIFFDNNLSEPQGAQSCSSCHDPKTGFTHPNSSVNEGSVGAPGANFSNDPTAIGTLKPPSAAYATFVAPFSACGVFPSFFCGGNFWNGRSIGYGGTQQFFSTRIIGPEIIESAVNLTAAKKAKYEQYLGPTADQAFNPFLNPVEQNTDELTVCKRVRNGDYAGLFTKAWGEKCKCNDNVYPGTGGLLTYEVNYRRIALSIAAYEACSELNSFSCKRDKALAEDADGLFPLDGFTEWENLGHDLFYGTNESGLNDGGPGGTPKNAGCTVCHLSDSAHPDGTGQFERYTDDGYHNIGTPPNPEIPFDPGPNPGLAGHTGNPVNFGEHKTPTLRNVDKRPWKGFTKAYTHNGWFKSLEGIVHFYNTAAMEEDLALFPFLGPKLHNVCRCPPEITTLEEALAYDEGECEGCWPAPESTNNIAIPFVVGNLGLTPEEEAAIVAYLKTLTDKYKSKVPD
jgi:cytochrome c peroxidase